MRTALDTNTAFERVSSEIQLERLRALARTALHAWGLQDAIVEPIKYRENAVFSVDAGGDRRYVMRVHRPGYRTDAHILSELAWADALRASGVLTPEAVATRDGELVCSARAEGVPQPRQCDLFHWIDGKPIGSIENGVKASEGDIAQTYRSLGELAAVVHAHGADWDKPTAFTRPAWDLAALVGEEPVFGKFWKLGCLSAKQLDVLLAARTEVRLRLRDFGCGTDRYGLIHGDFLPENVYCTSEGTRLLDFDDCGDSWYVFELATSLYFLRAQPEYALIRDAFVAGYRTRRELPDDQLKMLPTMLMARGLSYLGWPAGRPEIDSARQIAPFLAEDTLALARAYLDGL